MPGKLSVALFGGSFNPFHKGHLAITECVLKSGVADEVWILVTPCNPWKEGGRPMLPNSVRLDMVQKATAGMNGVKVSDFEFGLPKPTYTSQTLRAISEKYPGCEFSLVIGSDNWAEFGRWHDYRYILDHHHIIVYPRGRETIKPLPENATLLEAPTIEVSSTKIVERIKRGQAIEELVPPVVAEIIHRQGYYSV